MYIQGVKAQESSSAMLLVSAPSVACLPCRPERAGYSYRMSEQPYFASRAPNPIYIPVGKQTVSLVSH